VEIIIVYNDSNNGDNYDNDNNNIANSLLWWL
jgi:hypothetical protein